MSSKKVTLSVLSREQSEGVGARVRRSIGRPELKNLDPFLLFDEFKGGRPGGFPDHPHRGFETVSYLLEGGSMAHEDFCGHAGQLNPGDLQWMTAGQGIVHAEMPCSEEPVHGLQLWVNLRSSQKMVKPRYQELKSDEIPKPSQDGVTVAVISGEALGIKSKIYTYTPTLYLDFKLDQGAKHVQSLPKGWTSFIYTISGNVYIGPDDAQQKIEPHHTAVLGEGDSVHVENKELALCGQHMKFDEDRCECVCKTPCPRDLIQHPENCSCIECRESLESCCQKHKIFHPDTCSCEDRCPFHPRTCANGKPACPKHCRFPKEKRATHGLQDRENP